MNDLDFELRIAGIVEESVVDGIGLRMTVFTQGCPHHCHGCHNPQTHALDGGKVITVAEIADMVIEDPLLDGVTFSGGEPFLQSAPLAAFAAWLHKRGLNVWCYSGYTYEQLIELAQNDMDVSSLLARTDVLVDGKFILERRNLLLKFRGSDNQRVIDMNATRRSGKVVKLFD